MKHREATVYGQTIFEHAQGQQAANQFLNLGAEVVKRLGADQAMDAQALASTEFQVTNRG